MKRCKNCGGVYEDDKKFCPTCGQELDRLNETPDQSREKQKEKKSKRWIAEVVVAILLIAGTVFATLTVEHRIIPQIMEHYIADRTDPDDVDISSEADDTGAADAVSEADDTDAAADEGEIPSGADEADTVSEAAETDVAADEGEIPSEAGTDDAAKKAANVPEKVSLSEIQILEGDSFLTELSRIKKDNVGNEYTDGYSVDEYEGTYLLNGEYKTLTFDLAVDDDMKNKECSMCLEFYDENGNQLGKTDNFTKGVKPKEYTFSVDGVQELKVVPKKVEQWTAYHLLSHGFYVSKK